MIFCPSLSNTVSYILGVKQHIFIHSQTYSQWLDEYRFAIIFGNWSRYLIWDLLSWKTKFLFKPTHPNPFDFICSYSYLIPTFMAFSPSLSNTQIYQEHGAAVKLRILSVRHACCFFLFMSTFMEHTRGVSADVMLSSI